MLSTMYNRIFIILFKLFLVILVKYLIFISYKGKKIILYKKELHSWTLVTGSPLCNNGVLSITLFNLYYYIKFKYSHTTIKQKRCTLLFLLCTQKIIFYYISFNDIYIAPIYARVAIIFNSLSSGYVNT